MLKLSSKDRISELLIVKEMSPFFERKKKFCFFLKFCHIFISRNPIFLIFFSTVRCTFCIHLYCILKDFKSRYLGIDAKYIQAHIIITRYAKKETKKGKKHLKNILILVHSNLDIVNKSVRPFLFTISNNSIDQM